MIDIFYWREGHNEVDFVMSRGKDVVAIEVKSGRNRENMPGMELFMKQFKTKRILLVGSGGISIEEFLSSPPSKWID
jgi:predicted AAA+ superfamily ATPase